MRIRFALAAAVVATACVAPPAHAEVRLRVLTYNIHWAEGIRAATGKRTRHVAVDRVVRDIQRSGAEVVSLQEAQSYRLSDGTTFSEAREITKRLGWTDGGVRRHFLFRGGGPAAIWCRRPDGTPVVRRVRGQLAQCLRHGNALITRRPLRRQQSFSLWRADGNAADGDALRTFEGRVVLRGRIRLGGVPIWLLGTHLEVVPEVAACQLATALQAAAVPGPAVLLADLNMTSHTLTVPRCPEAPRRPFSLLREAGFRERRPVPFTYPSFAPSVPVDHILIRDLPSFRSVAALPNCRRRGNGIRVCTSDHWPLMARIVIRR